MQKLLTVKQLSNYFQLHLLFIICQYFIAKATLKMKFHIMYESCWFFSSFKLHSFSLSAWKITNITIRNLFLQMLTCKRKTLAKDSSLTDSKGTPTLMASFHLPTSLATYLGFWLLYNVHFFLYFLDLLQLMSLNLHLPHKLIILPEWLSFTESFHSLQKCHKFL